MARAPWTYELPPAGAPSAGLEEYVVETAAGDHVGKVVVVLRRGDDHYLAVDRGKPPLAPDLRAFPWSDVASVDHAGLTVRLGLSHDDSERSLELDPDKGVEGGEAEAVRVTELSPELAPAGSPEAGPVDRPSYLVSLALAVLGLLSLLALFVAGLSVEFTWEFVLFAIPAVLFAAAGIFAYRLFRRPYERP